MIARPQTKLPPSTHRPLCLNTPLHELYLLYLLSLSQDSQWIHLVPRHPSRLPHARIWVQIMIRTITPKEAPKRRHRYRARWLSLGPQSHPKMTSRWTRRTIARQMMCRMLERRYRESRWSGHRRHFRKGRGIGPRLYRVYLRPSRRHSLRRCSNNYRRLH